MHSLSRAVPARVIGVSRVSTGIDPWLLHFCDFLVVEALLDVEKLLVYDVLVGVAGGTHRGVPGRFLRAKEVAIDLMLDLRNDILGLRMIRVVIILPSSEARLVFSVV